MELQNLETLTNEAKIKFKEDYKNVEIKLHQEFKTQIESILSTKSESVFFLEYTSVITKDGSDKKIFLPNQWFCIAVYLVDYLRELIKYREILELINDDNGMPNREYWQFVKAQKGKQVIDTVIIEMLENYFADDIESLEYMKKFLTNYGWWKGKKSIDRNDYFVSPILNIPLLINDSQTYLSNIVYIYANDVDIFEEAKKLLEQSEDHDIPEQIRKNGKNLIVYGAPGTGKSRYVSDNYTDIVRVVFHSEYTYYDFIGTYKPTPLYKKNDDDNISLSTLDGNPFDHGEPLIDYSFVPGPFVTIIIEAFRNPTKMHTLLIEEINRANAAAVFGDMFQLLDRKTDGVSEYKINPSKDLSNYLNAYNDLKEIFITGFYLPTNLNIIATMNSADQGVFVLDSAFKRRWRYKYIPIIEEGFSHQDVRIQYAGQNYKWKHLLKCINNKLKDNKIEEDRLVGQYFINSNEILDHNIFTEKLFLYLWDDVLRHKRHRFFNEGLRTYSELVSAFNNSQDVLNIKESLDLLENDEISNENVDNDENIDDDVEDVDSVEDEVDIQN